MLVRAGAGAHIAVPVAGTTWDALAAELAPRSAVYASDAAARTRHWDVDWTVPAALIVSNEARGASAGARSLATHTIAIPMEGGVESLNAAVAGSVILYEAQRQRSHHLDRTAHTGAHRTTPGGTA
jgi:TrmH family RNA methyltransferase